jgi:hypothetical protein
VPACAAALVAVNPMLLWYSQEARGLRAAGVALRALAALLRAGAAGGRRGDFTGWGSPPASALATHYFAIFPIAAEAVLLLRREAGASPGPLDHRVGRPPAGAAPPAPGLQDHAEWIGNFSLGHRLWETACDLRGRRDRRHHRQPERPGLAIVPLRSALAPSPCRPARGREERASGRCAAGGRRGRGRAADLRWPS